MQVASIAVEDHDLPRDIDTIKRKALLGKSPKDAAVKLSAVDKMDDLKVTSMLSVSMH